jgi:hypothetical protein
MSRFLLTCFQKFTSYHDFPPSLIRHSGKDMEDDLTLCDYRVQYDAILDLIVGSDSSSHAPKHLMSMQQLEQAKQPQHLSQRQNQEEAIREPGTSMTSSRTASTTAAATEAAVPSQSEQQQTRPQPPLEESLCPNSTSVATIASQRADAFNAAQQQSHMEIARPEPPPAPASATAVGKQGSSGNSTSSNSVISIISSDSSYSGSSRSSGSMRIFVKTMTNCLLTLQIKSSDILDDLKVKIEDCSGLC